MSKRYRELFPNRCREFCPRCKLPCMHMENHKNSDDVPTVHVCGPHWWIEFSGPALERFRFDGDFTK